MEFQLSYFKSWKMMLWKCCTQYASKFGKLSSGHRTGKGQFSFRLKGNAKEYSNYHTIALISHTRKVTSKILQDRLQQYVNHELPDVQAGLEKAVEPEIKLPTSAGSSKKQASSRKTSISALFSTPKPLTKWITTKLQIILQVMGIPDHLTWLLRNLYAGQEATVLTIRTIKTDWFQIGKGVCQSCILTPCLFNLYAEYITRYARLEEAQAGIKIAGRNVNNLRNTDDTTLMAESE